MLVSDKFFSDSTHKSTIFSPAQINFLETNAYTKIIRGKPTFFIKCLVRGKEIRLTPEEAVRQMFIRKLIDDYGYKIAQMAVEHPIKFGRETKRADIVIFEPNNPTVEYIIVEVKKPKLKDGKEQLKSYCNATGSTMGVWSNGEKISFYHRKDPNYFEDIPDIPKSGQKLKDILRERRTIANLIADDKLLRENKTLADLIRELEDEVLANAGVDVFEEVFKLIYTKLFDEMLGGRDKSRILEFWNYGESDSQLKETIQELFDRAKQKWQGIFADDDKIKLTPSHLAICVSSLQNVKLFNSNLDVIDDAFEYLMTKSQKGEKGQFFTPRYVIDMCVRMLNPKINETMIDTAAGSCGFPVHTTFFVWKNILKAKNIPQSHLFSLEIKPQECEDYVRKNIFAIDFDEKTVRVARMLNLIAGDGKTNVLHLNTLDYERWNEIIDEDWLDIYNDGWKGLRKLRAAKNDNSKFNFDIVMANPPFAGDIKESRIITKYELGKNFRGKYQSKVGRDILFIERNLNFLKSGGRMAIILPQGRFNNSSDKYIRDFIAERCRILAVVGLHGNVFKPHTGTKTSVLFVQKWDEKLCPRRDDYPIFFATMREPSKDNSGEKILETDGEKLLRDDHNHTIIKHDLFNHDGKTRDGIAEAFIEFAKREGLSFFEQSSFDADKYKILSEELEFTEIFLSICAANKDFRVDSEYFLKKYLHDELNVSKFKNMMIYELALVSDGQHGYHEVDNNSNIHMLTAKNAKNWFADIDGAETVAKWVDYNNKRSSLKENDIIISTRGTVGCCALVFEKILPANLDQDIARVKLECNLICSEYLLAYLNSKFGQDWMQRNKTGMVQQGLSLEKIRNMPIPIVSKDFQAKIKEIVQSAFKLSERADENYHAAEKMLSAALNLENFKPSSENVAIKSFSTSFGFSGRLDAEFYQPKYDDIEKKLAELSSGRRVKDFFKLVKDICDRRADFYNYIEIGDVNISNGVAVANKISTDELPENAKIMTRENDVLVSKVRPNRGAVSILRENNLLVSGAFAVLRSSGKFSVEVLQVLLRTKIYRELMLKYNVGTSYPVIKDEDVLNLPLPVVSEEMQEKIAAQVSESFKLRSESEKLLFRAKKAVEIAIEQSEDAAIKFLDD